MITIFAVIGFVFVVVALIRLIRLKELNFNLKFHDDNKPPKQLKK